MARKQNKKFMMIGFSIVFAFLFGLSGIFGISKYKEFSEKRQMITRIDSMKPELLKLARINNKLMIIEAFKKDNMLMLDILKELSLKMPKNVYIRRFEYDYDKNAVAIRGRAGSYSASSRAVSRIGKVSYFSKIEHKGAHSIKVGNKKLVDFEVLGILSYGKASR